MAQLSDIGASSRRSSRRLYAPQDANEMIDHSIGGCSISSGIDLGTVHRWKEPSIPNPAACVKQRRR